MNNTQRKKLALIYYYDMKRVHAGGKSWVTLADKTAPTHHALVTTEENGLLVSILQQPAQSKDSYVEIMVTPNHPMHTRFNEAISVLSMAGEFEVIAGLGEAFLEGVYHVVITEEEHARLASNSE